MAMSYIITHNTNQKWEGVKMKMQIILCSNVGDYAPL